MGKPLEFTTTQWLVLVGQGHPSEKYEVVNWDDEIPHISGKIKLIATKPPTSSPFFGCSNHHLLAAQGASSKARRANFSASSRAPSANLGSSPEGTEKHGLTLWGTR